MPIAPVLTGERVLTGDDGMHQIPRRLEETRECVQCRTVCAFTRLFETAFTVRHPLPIVNSCLRHDYFMRLVARREHPSVPEARGGFAAHGG